MKRGLLPVVAAAVVCAGAWAALAYATFGPADVDDGLSFITHLLAVVPLGLGWLIAVRAPASPVGPALAWLAAFLLVTAAVEDWGETAATASTWWGSGFVAVAGAGAWPWQLVGFLALLLVFPDGLLPGRTWLLIALLVPLSAVLVNVAFVLTMNHHDVPPAHSPISVPESVWMPVMFGALGVQLAVVVASGASVVIRYRRGAARTRQQLRWLILAAGSVAVLMVGSWVTVSAGWSGPQAYLGFLLGIVVLVPAAVTLAVLRYDLLEIDRILSESVAWVLTTVVAAAMLTCSVVLAGYLIGRDTVVGLGGSVFLVALVLLPLHRRIQHAAGRALDRDRTVIIEGIRRFVDRVREGSAEPEAVQEVLREVVGDPGLTLLLTDLDGGGYVDLSGTAATPAADAVLVPLRSSDAEIGVMAVSVGSARRLRRAKLAVSAARLPIEVSRLRLGLRRALSEVGESRRRLVTATIDERRRLARDLHDGAQQLLVAVGMQLRAAQRQLPAGDPVAGDLDRAVEILERSISELRSLAHGIRPASLDDGLSPALRRLGAECPIPVDFIVDDLPIPEVVATTAYFVVAEAMANVLKHARATRIRVAVRLMNDQLNVSVTDDGIGGMSTDSGLTALRDRVGSIGGRLAVTSVARSGTAIEAVLPCVS